MIHKLTATILLLSTLIFTACNVPTEPPVALNTPTTDDGVSAEPTLTAIPTAQTTAEPAATAVATSTPAPAQTTEPLVPTNTPQGVATLMPTNMPSPEPSILDSDPQEWDSLTQWLFAARSSGMSVIEARQRLDSAGWMQDLSIFPGTEIAQDFRSVDLSGDTDPEWIVAVKIKDSAPISTPRGPKYAGNAYIVADDAVIPYFADPDEEINPLQTVAPSFLIGSIGDFTEDGIDDVIFEQLNCGANICYGAYRLLSYHNGFLQDVSDDRFSRYHAHPQMTIAPCEIGCRLRVELSIWIGPNFGGARHTELWAWNGKQLAYGGAVLDVPTEEAALEQWLSTYYRESDIDFERTIVPALLNSSWIADQGDFTSADFDGDDAADWVLHIAQPDAPMPISGRSGDVWVMSAGGLFKFSDALPDFDTSLEALDFQLLPDLTDDALPELLLTTQTCGAHTCFETYRVFSFHGGSIANIVDNLPDNSFGSSYTTIEIGDLGGQPTIEMHGGTIGSVGAGIVRASTEIWGWNGSALAFIDSVLDETNWQHHLLYEANALTQSGHAASIDAGVGLYERVIGDGSLEVHAFFDEPGQLGSYDASRQVAAFRLAYIYLRASDSAAAQVWIDFLEATYPAAPISAAARAMFDDYGSNADLTSACGAAQSVLSGYAAPLGALAYQGYGNPEMSSADLCP